jgi:hypothetical protein
LNGNVSNNVLVAAYLGQPLILRGHHQDFRHGMDVLDGPARFINQIGDVTWGNMTALSRMNYLWRMDGTTCRIKPLGRKIAFPLPSTATEVIVEGPLIRAEAVSAGDGAGFAATRNGEHLVLEMERHGYSPSDAPAAGLGSATLMLRRVLTEARDRLMLF